MNVYLLRLSCAAITISVYTGFQLQHAVGISPGPKLYIPITNHHSSQYCLETL